MTNAELATQGRNSGGTSHLLGEGPPTAQANWGTRLQVRIQVTGGQVLSHLRAPSPVHSNLSDPAGRRGVEGELCESACVSFVGRGERSVLGGWGSSARRGVGGGASQDAGVGGMSWRGECHREECRGGGSPRDGQPRGGVCGGPMRWGSGGGGGGRNVRGRGGRGGVSWRCQGVKEGGGGRGV